MDGGNLAPVRTVRLGYGVYQVVQDFLPPQYGQSVSKACTGLEAPAGGSTKIGCPLRSVRMYGHRIIVPLK